MAEIAQTPTSDAPSKADPTTSWSPLRITKRSPNPGDTPSQPNSPSSKRAPARRSSASFAHLRSHSLVSNSPFKSPTVGPPEGAKHRPQSAYAGLGITLPSPTLASNVNHSDTAAPARRISARKSALPGLSEEENEDPLGRVPPKEKRKPRKSKGLQELSQAERVTRSPFLPDGNPYSPMPSSGSEGSISNKCTPALPSKEEMAALPSPVSPVPPMLPPKDEPPVQVLPTPDTESEHLDFPIPTPAPATSSPRKHPSLSASPRRPALTSHRLHGPRTASGPGRRVSSASKTGGKRRRRKTVTFDERCDVLEFERDEGEVDGEVFEDGSWSEGTSGEEADDGWEEEEQGEHGVAEGELVGEDTDRMDRHEVSRGLVVVNAHPGDGDGLSPLVEQLVNSESPILREGGDLLEKAMKEFRRGGDEGSGMANVERIDVQIEVERVDVPGDRSMERIERDVEEILQSAQQLSPVRGLALPEQHDDALIQASFASSHTSHTSHTSRTSRTHTSFASTLHDSRDLDTSLALSALGAEQDGPDVSILSASSAGTGLRVLPLPDDSLDLSKEILSWSTVGQDRSHGSFGGDGEEEPSTPTNEVMLPPELREDAEGGVPHGRTHHAERNRWAKEGLDALAREERVKSPLGEPAEEEAFEVESPEEEEKEQKGGLSFAPSLPSVLYSPFILPPTGPSPTPGDVFDAPPPTPRITREEVRARLARRRPTTPTSPHTVTSTTPSTSSTPTLTHTPSGPASPVPVEKSAPVGLHEVELVHPHQQSQQSTPVRLDKALPPPPPPSVGTRSALDRLVEGVRGATPVQEKSEAQALGMGGGGRGKRVPVPKVERRNSVEERKEAVASRRERRGAEEGSDDEEERKEKETIERELLGVPAGRPKKRRSLSTGDVQTQIDRGMRLDDAVIPRAEAEGAFADAVNREIKKLHEPIRSYQIREHQVTVYASPRDKVSHVAQAGDVDSGRAWRTVRRPSDMNEYARQIREFRQAEKPGRALGKVFVRVLSVKGINVPIPPQPTFFTVTLNNGIHSVTTPEAKLGKETTIEQEFELIEHAKLEFSLLLKVRKDEHVLAQLRPPAPPLAPVPARETPPPKAPTPAPHRSAFRALFGSPKKNRQQPAPPVARPALPVRAQSEAPPSPVVEDCLARYLSSDGTLAQAFIAFKDIARRCDTRLFETSYPLMSRSSDTAQTMSGSVAVSAQKAVGEVVLQVFRLPALPGIDPDELPQSLEECHRGLRHVTWHKAMYHEGVLTQNGGDCSTWRRRRFRIVGANMVAFNDVTKKITATIELKKAVSVEDDQEPESVPQPSTGGKMTRSRSSDDNLFSSVQRSFRVTFTGGEEISFFADTDEDKAKWLEVLKALIGRIPPHPLWAELVWQRQEEVAKQSATANANKDQPAKRR